MADRDSGLTVLLPYPPADPATLQTLYNVVIRQLVQSGYNFSSSPIVACENLQSLPSPDPDVAAVLIFFAHVCDLTFLGRCAIATLEDANGRVTAVYIAGEQSDQVWSLIQGVWAEMKAPLSGDQLEATDLLRRILDVVVPYALERWKTISTPPTIADDVMRFRELSGLHASICGSLQDLEDKLNGTKTEAITSNDLLVLLDNWEALKAFGETPPPHESLESCTS